jgi:glutaminase
VAPAKWPTQQLGEYREFCADVWAMLESAGGLALALCATDGTTFARGGSGASQQPFALGQCAFPFLQALAISQSGARAISAQVGSERAPAGTVVDNNYNQGAQVVTNVVCVSCRAPRRVRFATQAMCCR